MWLARTLVTNLRKKNFKIAFAESCTGGMLAAALTAVPGSSQVFDVGVVTYANAAKMQILRVSADTLYKWGAVSAETAREMVRGLKELSQAEVAVAVTGIAGPGGGSADKPVGLVYVGYMVLDKLYVEKNLFSGSRKNIRQATVRHVLEKVNSLLEEEA